MTGKSAILMLMEKHGVNNNDMANALGITRAALWARLDPRKSDNITVNTLQEMLEVMGYEVVIVRKGFFENCKGVIMLGGEDDE